MRPGTQTTTAGVSSSVLAPAGRDARRSSQRALVADSVSACFRAAMSAAIESPLTGSADAPCMGERLRLLITMTRHQSNLRRALWAAIACVAASAVVRAQQPNPSRLTVERIFGSRDFAPERLPPSRWLDDSTYTTLQPGADGRGVDLVATDAATGRTTVVVSAASLTPPG